MLAENEAFPWASLPESRKNNLSQFSLDAAAKVVSTAYGR